MTKKYLLQNIRQMLTQGFSEADLRRFCFDNDDFRPVSDTVGEQSGKTALIDELLKHAWNRLLLDALLIWAESENKPRYQQHQPYWVGQDGPPSPQTARRLQVFLCHSTRDKAAIRELYARLEADGVQPWLDEEELLPGEDWAWEIAQAVKTSDAVLVCLSSHSTTSTGFVHHEIEAALEVVEAQPLGSIVLVPLRLEDCEVPSKLRRWHWGNLFEARGYKRLLRALRKRARAVGAIEPTLTKTPFIVRPAWHRHKDTIEGYGFRDRAHDVIHFTHEAQWAAWHDLAAMENAPDVDEYLRTLAPPEMVYIPAGAFLMGCPDDDPDAYDDEKPQHEVWLAGYYIDRTPVTNAQYRAFMEAGGYDTEAYWTPAGWAEKTQRNWREPRLWNDNRFTGDDKPVVGVSWYEALAYAEWAGKALPTEAHWEKAASWDPAAGGRRKYPWGNAWAEGRCNYNRTENGTTPVGKYSPGGDSAYGLVDCAGNVDEWCSTRLRDDSRGAYAYPYKPDDGREDLSGGNEMSRIVRGGSWYSSSTGVLRCGYRDWDDPDVRYNGGGFRCLSPTHSSKKSF